MHFYEVDSAGIVHFSWYFRYLEEAEHALWREAGLSIAAPGADIGFPRVAASFEYQRPLRFEDEFEVRLRVAALADKTIRYTCVLTRGETQIATGAITIACVTKRADMTMKAIPIPDEIASRFEVAGDGDA